MRINVPLVPMLCLGTLCRNSDFERHGKRELADGVPKRSMGTSGEAKRNLAILKEAEETDSHSSSDGSDESDPSDGSR